MKAAALPILFQLLLAPVPASQFELELLSGKIESDLREQGWVLVDKMIRDEVVYQRWQQVFEILKVSFLLAKTDEEAARTLREDRANIDAEFGAGAAAKIGNEAFQWTSPKSGQILISFRKGRAIVAVAGGSAESVKSFANRMSDLISSASAKLST